jgi:hypothetical protein
MTRIEIVTFVCNELGLYDATSLALAASFADNEYKMLWDRRLWLDTKVAAEIDLDIGQQTFNMPAGVARIISIIARSSDAGEINTTGFVSDAHFLDPITATYLMESDPNVLFQGGRILYYEELTNQGSGVTAVRVYPTPIHYTTFTILGKATCNGLAQDTDSPRIRNIDQALIAYVMADMLQRQRQYGKAKMKFEQAEALEAAAWALEVNNSNLPRRTKAVTVAGNSLVEIVDSVCTICGQWSPEIRIAIKEFVRRNYQALYDSYLWPESIVMVRMEYFNEQVVLPHYIDKILGIRSVNKDRLTPVDQTLFLDISPAIFDETGDPVGYSLLTPVGVSVLPTAPTRLRLASTYGPDLGYKVFIRGELLATGIEQTEEVTLNGNIPVDTVKYYDVPLTISKDVTLGDLTVNAADDDALLSLEVIPANERERKHQRILLSPVPTTVAGAFQGTPGALGDLLILGKRHILPLRADNDTTIITGVHQVLISAAAADLYLSLGKPELAQPLQAKAEAAAKMLMKKNEDQQAREPRFVPSIEPYAFSGVEE